MFLSLTPLLSLSPDMGYGAGGEGILARVWDYVPIQNLKEFK